MAVMRDPKGNELKVILLQIMEKDDQGPTVLRARRDHETINLASGDEFLVVWAPVDSVLGELRISDVYEELERVKALQARAADEHAEFKQSLASIERELEALEVENKTKTDALRQLQKERDPERLEAMARERTAKLDSELMHAHGELVTKSNEIAELRAAKRRLKEANERLREQLGGSR